MNENKKLKAIIFDRDGTLNITANNAGGYVTVPSEMVLLPETKQALTLVRENNIIPLVFTQQKCINKGLVTENGLVEIHNYMQELLGKEAKIEKFYHCPHLSEEGCDCCKPKPGMLLQAMQELNLKPEEVVVIGDTERDFLSAKSAGIKYIMVNNSSINYEYKTCRDVLEAVESLL